MDDIRKKMKKTKNMTEEQAPEKETAESESLMNNNLAADRQEADAEAQEQAIGAETIGALKEELDGARKQAADSYDRLLRLTAEFENYKKRAQRQAEEYRKFANEALIKDLVAIIDNLERAVGAASPEQAGEGASCMVEGVEMTLNEIFKMLKRYNVTPVEAKGKPFDPTYHEAVMQEASEEYPENTVINELQKGYLLHDRLIRPAMVVVSKGH